MPFFLLVVIRQAENFSTVWVFRALKKDKRKGEQKHNFTEVRVVRLCVCVYERVRAYETYVSFEVHESKSMKR